jgi:hypothetical protein
MQHSKKTISHLWFSELAKGSTTPQRHSEFNSMLLVAEKRRRWHSTVNKKAVATVS